ncbi:MAG: multicopper oxidase family protein, partial [Deltaproteobacteria bacterium]
LSPGGELPVPAAAPDLDPDPDVVRYALRAAPREDGSWAYDGQVPGPTLRAKVGDTVVVELQNDLPNPTTIHWHGLAVPFAMDGVPWMRDPVAAGASFTYTFEVTEAGTFWYHPHFDTLHQVDLGLYGLFVVDAPGGPHADRELELVFDQPTEAARAEAAPAHDHGLVGEAAPWLVNGALAPTVRLARGERVLVRILNASNGGYLDLAAPGMRQVGGDQGRLAALAEPEHLVLAPGDRVELEWLGAGAGFTLWNRPYSAHGGSLGLEPEALLTVAVEGEGADAAPVAWSFAAPAPTPDPGHTDLVYVLTGADEADTWMINGERFPDVTVREVALGTSVVVEVRNLSVTEHPFHLHGHAFEVLSVGGVPPAARRVEDTLNVRIREPVRLLLHADNPGDWMAHCHILPHADQGMMTVLRVGDVR